MSTRYRAPEESGRRLGWKVYSLVMAALYLGGLRQGMHQDALEWLDWTAAVVGAFALAGLTAYSWRLPGGGAKFWRIIAGADLAILGLAFWAMVERAPEQASAGIMIAAMIIVSAVHLPEVVAVWRFGSPSERARGN